MKKGTPKGTGKKPAEATRTCKQCMPYKPVPLSQWDGHLKQHKAQARQGHHGSVG